jgi:hypothetical protein
MTDDGSTESRTSLTPPTQPSVDCVAGTCTSYVTECGAPCPTGTVCFSCQTAGKRYAACTTECLDPKSNADCKNAALPLCQTGTTGNVAGNYCTASDIACDRK